MGIVSGLKRLTAGNAEGESTAVVEYQEPKQVSSRKRRKSSAGYKPVEGSWRYRPAKGSRSQGYSKKSNEQVIDAQYSDVVESVKQLPSAQKIPSAQKRLQSQTVKEPIKSPKIRRISSATKRIDYDIGWVDEPATQSPQKASKNATKAIVPSPIVRSPVAASQAEEKLEDLGEYVVNRIKSGIRRDAKKAYRKYVEEPAVEKAILKKAEQGAYAARKKELFEGKIPKAKEVGIHKAETTAIQRAKEKIGKVEKASGKAIVGGIRDLDRAVTTFDQSQMAKNITRTNEATLKGMQAAGIRARDSVGAGKVTLTRSALNKPRTFGSSSSTPTGNAAGITTGIVRRGKNDIACYFYRSGRQISAAKAMALIEGAVIPQKSTPETYRARTQFVTSTYSNPFWDTRHYEAPFMVGYHYNPLGDVRNHGAPIIPGNYYGNPLGQVRKEGNPLGDMRRYGAPFTIRYYNPLGSSEKSGHTSRMVRSGMKNQCRYYRG